MAGLGSIMSPLETINKVKDEKRSLDSLARFPYPVLMGMVKNKEIKPEEISIVMGRKAEIIQEEANRRALEQRMAGGIPSTITDRNMALIARSEAPRDMTDVGIAQNEVPPMRMAGGGIIAFDRGGDVQHFEEGGSPFSRFFGLPSAAEKERMNELNSIYQGLRSQTAPIGMFKEQTAEEYDTAGKLAEYLRKEQRNIAKDPELFAKFKADPYAFSNIERPKKTTPGRATDLPKETPAAPVVTPKSEKPAAPAVPPSPKAEKDDYMSGISDMIKEIRAEREALKGNKQDNINQALLAAGLGMMGGTSPYALANIGAGGMRGAEQYSALQAQDTKARQALLKEMSDAYQVQGILGEKAADRLSRERLDAEAF